MVCNAERKQLYQTTLQHTLTCNERETTINDNQKRTHSRPSAHTLINLLGPNTRAHIILPTLSPHTTVVASPTHTLCHPRIAKWCLRARQLIVLVLAWSKTRNQATTQIPHIIQRRTSKERLSTPVCLKTPQHLVQHAVTAFMGHRHKQATKPSYPG